MYSPIAEASIKDLEIKDNKAMVHTEKSYKENNVLRWQDSPVGVV